MVGYERAVVGGLSGEGDVETGQDGRTGRSERDERATNRRNKRAKRRSRSPAGGQLRTPTLERTGFDIPTASTLTKPQAEATEKTGKAQASICYIRVKALGPPPATAVQPIIDSSSSPTLGPIRHRFRTPVPSQPRRRRQPPSHRPLLDAADRHSKPNLTPSTLQRLVAARRLPLLWWSCKSISL